MIMLTQVFGFTNLEPPYLSAYLLRIRNPVAGKKLFIKHGADIQPAVAAAADRPGDRPLPQKTIFREVEALFRIVKIWFLNANGLN